MNLFDSHDTARALWMLQGDTDALKMLTLMMACAPGPSMLYQGTEVGLSLIHISEPTRPY